MKDKHRPHFIYYSYCLHKNNRKMGDDLCLMKQSYFVSCFLWYLQTKSVSAFSLPRLVTERETFLTPDTKTAKNTVFLSLERSQAPTTSILHNICTGQLLTQ